MADLETLEMNWVKFEVDVFVSSIELKWDAQTDMEGFGYYEIKYKEASESKFSVKNMKQIVENETTLCNLKSNTAYVIKGYIVNEDDEKKTFIEITLKTKESMIPTLVSASKCVCVKPPIYKLPCVVRDIEGDCLRECYMGEMYEHPTIADIADKKTILVVGATGSGKSTLIDAMINHIVDVSFKDESRFKMVDLTIKEQKFIGQQTISQTSTTTCYRIPRRNGFSIDYPLNIIDTPGFDDTRGKSFDKEIPIQIRKLFESVIQSLHAVCIVVPLSNTRLTEAQKWVFHNILNLFGANIKNIIYPCITHDDGGDTKCLSALQVAQIPYKKFFRFNNSDIFLEEKSESNWIKRNKSLKEFFSEIGSVEPQCLKSSEEVLKAREKKTSQLENVQAKIRIQVQIVNTIKNEERVLQRFESEIESNKDFTYDECVAKTVEKKTKKRNVNCNVCKESCHKRCWVPFDKIVALCEVFSSGKCTICTQKCTTDHHELQNVEYETVFEKETKTKEDLEKKYKDAVQGQKDHKSMVEMEQRKLRTSLQELKSILHYVKELIASLNEIALQREHFSVEMYLNEVIELENETKQYGYLTRIEFISKMKHAMAENKQLDKLIQELSV